MNCPKDDSGDCCGLCDTKVFVVIATHQRKEITTRNINELKLLTPQPKIVIVCSLQEEFEYYKTLGVTVALEPNKPLGRKWQCGVNIAKNMYADVLLILGSDDLMKASYYREIIQKMKDYDFIGTSHWLMEDERGDRYHCNYMNLNEGLPIGSGRFYSKKGLDYVRWKIFDTAADRKLDDHGFKMIKKNNLRTLIYTDPYILAVKGKWPQMNPPQAYKSSRNISCKRIYV